MTESSQRNVRPAGLLARIFRGQQPTMPEYMRVFNATRQTAIGDRIEIAGTASRRNKGLLGRTGLGEGEGLWIVPCEAVHTFGMKFSIDLIYLDRERRVVKVRHAVPPGRISGAFRAHSVIELPRGAAAASVTSPGDLLEFDSAGRGE